MSRLAWIPAGLLAVLLVAAHAAQAANSRADVDGMVRQAISKCWTLPAESGPQVITVQFELNRDGSLVGSPAILDSQPPAPDASIQAALRAIRKCTPIALPPELYDYWRNVVIRFVAQAPGRPFGASAWPQ